MNDNIFGFVVRNCYFVSVTLTSNFINFNIRNYNNFNSFINSTHNINSSLTHYMIKPIVVTTQTGANNNSLQHKHGRFFFILVKFAPYFHIFLATFETLLSNTLCLYLIVKTPAEVTTPNFIVIRLNTTRINTNLVTNIKVYPS